MALTTKPITTISYNSKNFLLSKLIELKKSKKIVDYRFIFHFGELGDKDHYHLILFPHRRIDTEDLRDFFKEADPNNVKPLGVLPFRICLGQDGYLHWLLYVLHDPIYLNAHNSQSEDGKIIYSISDIICDSFEQLERDYRKSLQLQETTNHKIVNSLLSGKNAIQTIVSISNVNPIKVATIYNLFKQLDLNEINDLNNCNLVYKTDINNDDDLPF